MASGSLRGESDDESDASLSLIGATSLSLIAGAGSGVAADAAFGDVAPAMMSTGETAPADESAVHPSDWPGGT